MTSSGRILRDAVLMAALWCTAAGAEEWYTLTHETTDVTFAIEEQSDGRSSVWLRFAAGAASPEETRLLLATTCSPATAIAIEARQYDTAGRELLRRRLSEEAVADERWLALLIGAVCQYEPAPRPSGILDSTATEANVVRMLRSEEEAERRRAVALILSEPGAFPPLVFVRLASELIDQGREREAFEWFAFGYARMLVDMRAAVRVDERYAGIAGIISPMYGITGPYELGPSADHLSEAEKRTLFLEALSRDAELPRLYPVDWFVSPVSVMNVAWGSPAAPRPGTDFAIRRELEPARSELLTAPMQP